MFTLKPPAFTRGQIIRKADNLCEQYVAIKGKNWIVANGLDFWDLYHRVIYPDFEIGCDENVDLGYDETGTKVLGRFDAEPNCAHVDPSLRDDPRRIFTLYHEVCGHGILHGSYLRQQLARHGRLSLISTEATMAAPEDIETFEQQANLFAATAAAPMWLVDAVIEDVFSLRKPFIFLRPTEYCFNPIAIEIRRRVDSFSSLCWQIAKQIRSRFGGLSAQALGYRVQRSKWVDDRSRRSPEIFRLERPVSRRMPASLSAAANVLVAGARLRRTRDRSSRPTGTGRHRETALEFSSSAP